MNKTLRCASPLGCRNASKPQRQAGSHILLGAVVVTLLSTVPEVARAGQVDVIDEIVVTARQRSETLQQVPIAISALTSQALEEGGFDTLKKIEFSVPNLVFGETGSSGETHIGMRGIGDFSRNVGFDTRVGVYIDDVFIGQSLAVDQSLVDIAQIDVLRGPQGTLFGKNTSSGVISIATNRPELGSTQAEVTAFLGSRNTRNGSIVANLPLGDRSAARISFMGQQQDGHVENLTSGKDLMSNDHYQGRGRLLFQPSNQLDLDLSVDYGKQNNDTVFLEPVDDPFAPRRRQVAQDGPLIDQNTRWGAGLKADYLFLDGALDGFALTAISGFRHAERKVGSDEDASPEYGLHVAFFEDEFQHFTQELRLASPEHLPFRYVVGGYYFRQSAEQSRQALFGPAFGAPEDTLAARGGAKVDTEAWAGFVNANYDLTPAVTLTAGLRYTREEKDLTVSQFGAPVGLADFFGFTDSFTDHSLTATVNAFYQATDDVGLYAAWSRGHKSGGWNVDFIAATDFLPFDEETVDSFEIGARMDLFDRRLRLNITAFRAEYDDFQVFQFQQVGPSTLLRVSNAAEVVTQGVEFEGIARLTDAFEVSYALGYADAEFDDFPGGATDDAGVPVNIAGNQLPRAPKLTSSVTARYNFPVGELGTGRLVVNYTRRGKQFFNPDNRDGTRQDTFGLLNASLEVDLRDSWTLFVRARNLTDKDYRVNRGVSFLGIPFDLWAPPRTWSLGATYRFQH